MMSGLYNFRFKESCLAPEEQDPLFAACSVGDVDRVKEIMHDLKKKQEKGNTFKRDGSAMETFTLDIDRIVNDMKMGGLTPLHVAATNGHAEVVRTLVEDFGAAVDVKSFKFGDTPLHEAVHNRNEEMARLLVERYGADPSVENDEGKSPLDVVKMDEKLRGKNKCREFLEEHGNRNQ
eukprot:gb/GECG01001106.1/.p1 GENE.gb/GECG01001106.1/~~gb/GECG01001106.1/.p1  ORF type:complete len:178 (+),score=28.72 gb/GECG01001106.1/:1-534(+)